MADPYLDENGVLKNKLNASTSATLSRLEDSIVSIADRRLYLDLPKHFSADTLLEIHRRLFERVYTWAGKPRIIDISKETKFTSPFEIGRQLDRLFKDFPSTSDASRMDKNTFAEIMAPMFVELNNIHPFREGNGRTQRTFFKLFAQAAGHTLVFDVVTKERMIHASVQGAKGDVDTMKRIFHEISNPVRVAALEKVIVALKAHYPRDWNDIYLATTNKGQTYQGKLAGKAGEDFLMQAKGEERNSLIVGKQTDLPSDAEQYDNLVITPKLW